MEAPRPAPLLPYLRGAAAAELVAPAAAGLRAASALQHAGDAAGARTSFRAAARAHPGIADWARVLEAEAAASAGDTAGVRAALAEGEPGLVRERGWQARAEGFRKAGDPVRAAEAAASAAPHLGTPARRAEAWVRAAELRLARGDTAAARADLARALDAAPRTAAALRGARALRGLRGATPDERKQTGRVLLAHAQTDPGIADLEAYLASVPAGPADVAEVRLEIGRARQRAGRHAEAERTLLALARLAPPAVAAEALLLAARSQYRQGAQERAVATFRQAADRFPEEAAVVEALFAVADLDHDAGRHREARAGYARVLAAPGSSPNKAAAAMRLGGLDYLDGRPERAAATFERSRDAHPRGEPFQAATYWMARMHHAAGDRGRARELFRETVQAGPVSYYGLRALESTGGELSAASLPAGPRAGPRVEEEARGALARLAVLREAGIPGAVELEMERVRLHFDGAPEGLYPVAEGLQQAGQLAAGIRLGWDVFRAEGAWNRRLLRIVYPFPYRGRIVAEAGRWGIDPFLVAGLIRQESMFDSAAVSGAGAVGLMQVMPETGRSLARSEGIPGFRPEQLKRPDLNLRLGVHHLAGLLRAPGARLTDVLAGYNAGSGRVARWRAFPEFRDEELFAERIPYAETREYVQVVQRNARLYAWLYGAEPVPGARAGGDR